MQFGINKFLYVVFFAVLLLVSPKFVGSANAAKICSTAIGGPYDVGSKYCGADNITLYTCTDPDPTNPNVAAYSNPSSCSPNPCRNISETNIGGPLKHSEAECAVPGATRCTITAVTGLEPHFSNGSPVNPPISLDINKTICLPGFNNTIARCDNDTGLATVSFTYCDHGCLNGACVIPTNTPTPLPGLPTATPGVAPTATAIQCNYPGIGGSNYNIGSRICFGNNFGIGSIKECTPTGDWIDEACLVANCEEIGSPPFTRAQCKIPFPTPTPISTNPLCLADLSVGQRWSNMGDNCGVPVEQLVPDNISIDGTNYFTVYKVNEDHPIHTCCYSRLAFLNIPPSCYIGTGFPGADTLIDWIGTTIISIIDRTPMFWDNGPGAFNIRNIRQAATDLEPCQSGSAPRDGKKANEPGCTCVRNSGPVEFCDNMSNSEEMDKCTQCVKPTSEDGGGGIWTGIGCIPVESEGGFVQSLLGLGVSLGGGMSLLCLMYAALLFQTSRGSPEPLKKARDLIASCLTGLLLIIFAVFILNLVGYTILRIPGFGGP